MHKQKPDPKILTVWRILLILAILPAAFLCSMLLAPGSNAWLLATAAWTLSFLVCYLWYLPAHYNGISYWLSGDSVVLCKGVFYTSELTIPVNNIQFNTIVVNPLCRLFGLATLLVVSPGGRLSIPGLKRKDAEDLASLLIRE